MEKAQKFLRRSDVEAMTGLPCSTIYEMMERGSFPRPVRLSPRIVGWIESEVIDWQRSRIAERDAEAA
ncbi:helix-turn-helix transcriptional regulator [Oricola sp.]|uniref:helix-turn-helix transcriptional regulator n=1 Tax=Oricola sp. TaxID=1979950 RepID=UPI00320BF8DB|nr:AlpA family phage regulatory protein [Oricola sp.]